MAFCKLSLYLFITLSIIAILTKPTDALLVLLFSIVLASTFKIFKL